MYSRYDPKACDRCSKLHICTGTAHCPCFDQVVPEMVLEYISSHFDGCLCNECMEELNWNFLNQENSNNDKSNG